VLLWWLLLLLWLLLLSLLLLLLRLLLLLDALGLVLVLLEFVVGEAEPVGLHHARRQRHAVGQVLGVIELHTLAVHGLVAVAALQGDVAVAPQRAHRDAVAEGRLDDARFGEPQLPHGSAHDGLRLSALPLGLAPPLLRPLTVHAVRLRQCRGVLRVQRREGPRDLQARRQHDCRRRQRRQS
jgi:hypothetical protein